MPVWQFHFRREETKNGDSVRGVLPRRLIAPLDEYVEEHRPVLLGCGSSSALFIRRGGRPFSKECMEDLVSSLTARHCGVHVTPHQFRHAFALMFLEENVKD